MNNEQLTKALFGMSENVTRLSKLALLHSVLIFAIALTLAIAVISRWIQ